MTKDLPFSLVDLPNGYWAVSWPDIKPIVEKATGIKLMDILFEDIGCFQIGLGIKHREDDPGETMWIDATLYWQDNREEFFLYALNRYQIFGVQFCSQQEAEKFYNILEKKLSWYYLTH